MRRLVKWVGLGTFAFAAAGPATAQQLTGGDPQAGRAFALEACTPCHVVSSRQLAPPRFANAPRFHDIANAEAMNAMKLQALLSTPHPTMPNLVLSPDEAADVIAYIMTLRDK